MGAAGARGGGDGAVRSPVPTTEGATISDDTDRPERGEDHAPSGEDEPSASWSAVTDVVDLDAGPPPAALVGVGAPPVVAIVLTADPGDWFTETLESLAEQDYGSLSVLIIDNAGEQDPTPRVAEVLPGAFVKRLEVDRGLAAAANEVLAMVEGAAFHLFLHDDVRLAADTVTTLVAEAFRANAGIVGPKLVDWDDPRRLRSVGLSVDPYGFSSELSDPDEIDQSQHDIAREVFAVSDACLLVRADLFTTLGGFSEDIPYFGGDIDLCWRAHVAAATVQFCPRTSVGHRGRFDRRRRTENRHRLELRHQGRTMARNYGLRRLVWVLPVVALLSLVDLVGSAVLGRFARAGDILAAWTWNLVNVPSLVGSRARVRSVRAVRDVEYLPLMRQGSSRLAELVRAQEGDNRLQAAALAGRGYVQRIATESNPLGVALGIVAAALVLIGARGLLTGPLPVLREFVGVPASGGELVAQWWSGWREAGLGEAAVAPPVVPGLGVLATVLFGAIGLARRILLVAPIFVGALGAWKLLAVSRSTAARAAMLAAYALNPVTVNAVSEGRLQALVFLAGAPWLLRRVARNAGSAPFATEGASHRWREVAGTSIALALVASVTPLGAAILVVSLVVLTIGPALTGSRSAARRQVTNTLGAGLLAAVAISPWLVAAVRSGDAATLTGLWSGRGATPSAAELITGSTGPVVVGLFGWGLLVAGGYALLAGRSWRFAWALSGWVLAVLSWGAAVLAARADLLAGAGAELLLAPAVLGTALAVAMGALAFEHDVVGADFGAAQVLSGIAALALVVGLLPVAVAAADGRWYLPEGDFGRVLEPIDDADELRTAWIGDPDVLAMSGWELDDVPGVAVGVSEGADPTITQRYRLDGGPGVEVLGDAVSAALRGETSRLGRVLATMGIAYLVVVDRPAPSPFAEEEVPLPAGAVAALRQQLDLSEVPLNPAMVVFRVDDPWPLRSDVTDAGLGDEADGLSGLVATAREAPPAVLGQGLGTRFSGQLDPDRRIAQASTASPQWRLEVDGAEAERSGLAGWQQQFLTPAGGTAELSWTPDVTTRGLQVLQVLVLLALLGAVIRRRPMVAPPQPGRRRRIDRPVMVFSADGDMLDPAEDVAVVAGDAVGDADEPERDHDGDHPAAGRSGSPAGDVDADVDVGPDAQPGGPADGGTEAGGEPGELPDDEVHP